MLCKLAACVVRTAQDHRWCYCVKAHWYVMQHSIICQRIQKMVCVLMAEFASYVQ
jgi:hypothetical protein